MLVGLAYLAVCSAALVATYLYVASEKVFYYWDSYAYQRAALGSLDAFHQSLFTWLLHLRGSIQNGYSEVYTVFLAPLQAGFGESRATYILGLVGFYLLPFATVSTFLVRSLVPRLSPAAFLLCFCACLSLPAIWQATLIGYPDVGGLVLAWTAILVYFSDRSLSRLTNVFAIGLLLAGTFLFRRHLIYVVIPLLVLMGVFSFGGIWGDGQPRQLGRSGRMGLKFALIGILIVGSLALLAPHYLSELAATSYRELYKPFQNPVRLAAEVHFHWVGGFYWILAGLGFALGLRDPVQRWKSAFLLSYTVFSFGIWALYLRYTSIQHNLHFSGMVACGLGALAAYLYPGPRASTRRVLAAAAVVGLLVAVWADRFLFVRLVPASTEIILPAQVPPRRDLDYDAIRRLTEYLHNAVADRGQVVLFDASSILMNSDMISTAEQSLYGRRQSRMTILYGGQMDTIASYPLRDMLAADWIVHTEPFQSHLSVKDQGVVEAICRSLTDPWEISRDFELLPTAFHFQHDTTVRIYRRIRETSFPATVVTARRVFDLVGDEDAWNGRWMLGYSSSGAEYYDARILHPKTRPFYTADFEQVKMRLEQTEITLFVRLPGGSPSHLKGRLTGSSGRNAELRAEFYADAGDPAAPGWTQQLGLRSGENFALHPATTARGILALRLVPQGKPPSGTPLGLMLDDLLVTEK